MLREWLYSGYVAKAEYDKMYEIKMDMIKEKCKEIDALKSQLTPLLGQIQEQKGILDYTLADKEKEIEELNRELVDAKDKIAELEKSNERVLADAAIAIQNKGVLMEKCDSDCKKDPADFFKEPVSIPLKRYSNLPTAVVPMGPDTKKAYKVTPFIDNNNKPKSLDEAVAAQDKEIVRDAIADRADSLGYKLSRSKSEDYKGKSKKGK